MVYGTIYGLSPFGLSQQLAGQGVDMAAAARLISSFGEHFAGVRAFEEAALRGALQQGHVTTMLGRR